MRERERGVNDEPCKSCTTFEFESFRVACQSAPQRASSNHLPCRPRCKQRGWGRRRDGGVSVINGKSGRGACATHETLHASASIGRLSKARQRTCTSLALSSPAYRSISPLSSPFLVSHTCCSWRPLHGVAEIQNRVNNCVRVKKVLFFFFSE